MAGAVRQPIDVPSLERYITENVPQIKTPIGLKQFGFGQSNPTYQITDSTGMRYVMRKKPPGKLLSKTAHQVEREYRIIHALENTDVPVPKAYCLCEDASIIGTAFYIMEFLDGRIIVDASMPDVTPEERTEMWHDAVRTLAKFHKIKPKEVGLESYGRPSGFYDRQIKTFSTINKLQGETRDAETDKPVGPIPHFDDMIDFFKDKQMQPKDRGTLVHGDYKIDNVVFHKTEPRVIGVLDWEMSTIGHPLSDIVNLLNPYTLRYIPGKNELYKFHDGVTPGLPTQDQIVRWYAEVAGWDPNPDIPFGKAFGFLKATVIYQGIAARYARRQASSAQAKANGQMMHPIGEYAWATVQEAKKKPKGVARL